MFLIAMKSNLTVLTHTRRTPVFRAGAGNFKSRALAVFILGMHDIGFFPISDMPIFLNSF